MEIMQMGRPGAGGCVRLILSILLAWGCVGIPAGIAQSQGADGGGPAPAVDLGRLEKPQAEVLTPSEIAQGNGRAGAEVSIKRPVIALLDFETSTLDVGEAKAISQALWARLKQRGDLGILPREATRRWLISVDMHPFTPYRTDLDMASVAKALKVDYLVYGNVDKVANTCLIDYSVYSARLDRLVILDAELRRVDLDQLIVEVGALARIIGDGIVEAAGGATPSGIVQPGDEAGPVGHKKPEQASKVRIRKADVLDKPDTSASEPVRQPAANGAVVELKPAETGSGEKQPEAAPEPAQTAKTDTNSDAQANHVETAPEPKPVPREVADPAREAFNKALELPKNSKERLAALKEAVALDPKTLDYQRMLIDEYFRQGLYRECIEVCDQALGLKPGDSLLLTVQGAAYFELNRLPEARAAYEKAIASDPENWYARYNLAQTLTVLKSPDAAQAWRDYLEVAGEDPGQTAYVEEARRNLARLDGNQGE